MKVLAGLDSLRKSRQCLISDIPTTVLNQLSAIHTGITRNVAGKTRYFAEYFVYTV